MDAAVCVADQDARLVIRTALECAAFGVREFDGPVDLVRGVKREDVRVVVIDTDGHTAAEADWRGVLRWRANWLNPNVVVVGVGSGDAQATRCAFEEGVDDYVVKPIRGAELVFRITTALRRGANVARTDDVQLGGCRVDRHNRCLRSDRAKVPLTGRELGVVQMLFENAGRPVTRQRLAAEVWSARVELTGRTIEQHIYQVRRKLRLCVGGALSLTSIYGCGYQLDPTTAQAQSDAATPVRGRKPAADVRPCSSAGAHLVWGRTSEAA
jgi:DNA-binding response OmpR family regulator